MQNKFFKTFLGGVDKPGHDLLGPLGEYVGVTATSDDAQSEDENPVSLIIAEEAPDADDSADAPLSMDFDDFLPDTTEGIEEHVEPEAFSKTLIIDGKEFLKSSVVASLSSNRSKKVTI
jgi:hypothetical protein